MDKPELNIDRFGNKFWILGNSYHNDAGPAVEYVYGYKEWRINGLLHNEAGPAIERPDGTREYWINGRRVAMTDLEFFTKYGIGN